MSSSHISCILVGRHPTPDLLSMPPSIITHRVHYLLAATLVSNVPAANPDFTRGDQIPEGANHDWTLGKTGARGWIFSDKPVRTDARQIAVTNVEKGSPVDEVLAIGDVRIPV
jgi:hypothetical protein